MNGFALMNQEVIKVGLCTFCGCCVGTCMRGHLTVNYQQAEPVFCGGQCPEECNICYLSCPGKDINIPKLEQMVFNRQRTAKENLVGIVKDQYLGYAISQKTRKAGASGGVATALLQFALENNIIDGAIVAGMQFEKPWLGEPRLVTTSQELLDASQSKYTPIPMVMALQKARAKGLRRLAITALPCQVHGLRKMQQNLKKLFSPIKFIIGLFCGFCAPCQVTEHLITEVCKTPLMKVKQLEFRAGEYPGNFRITRTDGTQISISSASRRIFSIGFLRDRCTMCIDWANDLADIALGDHFAKEMVRGADGITTVIVRSDIGSKLVEQAAANGYISLKPFGHNELLSNIALEYKKHGFNYHLHERKRWGWPTPNFHLEVDDQPFVRKLTLEHPHLE